MRRILLYAVALLLTLTSTAFAQVEYRFGSSVDARALDSKDSVRVGTTTALPANTRVGNVLTANANGSINSSGIDGITNLAIGDRVLVMNEASGANDGIFGLRALGSATSKWSMVRTDDASTSQLVTSGLIVYVEEGATNEKHRFQLITVAPITLNTTALVFAEIIASGGGVTTSRTLTAGAGLTGGGDLSANRTFDVVAADATIVVNADSIQVGTIGSAQVTDGSITAADLGTNSCDADEIAPNSVTLTTDTVGNYVASVGTNVLTGLAGGAAGSEGATLSLAFDYSQALTGDVGLGANACVFGQSGLACEGATADAFETYIAITDSTADRTITVPDRSGTVCLSGDAFTGDVTGTLASNGSTALTVAADAVALGTDTTGSYAAGDAEAGAALTGDSATSFFSTGTLEDARLSVNVSLLGQTIDSSEIVNDTIVDADINTGAAIAFSKLASLASGNMLVGSAGGVPTPVAMSGDIAISNTGVTTVQADAIALTTDTTGNYVASANTSATTGLTGGSAGSEAAALSLALDYSATLAGNPALASGACVMATTGIICEGATANTSEALMTFADVTGDQTYTFPDRSGTVCLSGDTFTGDVTGTLQTTGATALTVAADAVALTTDTTGNYVASANTSVLTGLTGGSAGSEGAALSLAFDYSQTLSGDVALGANACVFGVNGLACEGATANTFETYISITDPTADRAIVVPDRAGTVSLSGDTFTGDVTGTLATNGATALTVADNSVDGTDIALGSDAQGDVMYYDGTDWVRLAAGTNGQVLTTAGVGANPSWTTISGSPGTQWTTCSGGGLSTERFMSVTGCFLSSTELNTKSVVAVACTAKTLRVAIDTAPGGATSWAITLRKNGANTALTCTISGSATSCTDLVNTVAIAAGDLVDIDLLPSGAVNTTNFGAGLVCQ